MNIWWFSIFLAIVNPAMDIHASVFVWTCVFNSEIEILRSFKEKEMYQMNRTTGSCGNSALNFSEELDSGFFPLQISALSHCPFFGHLAFPTPLQLVPYIKYRLLKHLAWTFPWLNPDGGGFIYVIHETQGYFQVSSFFFALLRNQLCKRGKETTVISIVRNAVVEYILQLYLVICCHL